MSRVAETSQITMGSLWRQYLPLAVSDVTMMASDPLVTTTLAHLPEARLNLAAVGVAKSLAVFFESPIIMLLHASNVLAGSRASRRAIWRFMLLAIGALTALMAAIAIPAVFRGGPARLFGTDALLTDRALGVMSFMVLWPAAIGWRRYFQGLLIHAGRSGAVAGSGFARIAFVAFALFVGAQLGCGGATLAALALVGGVIVEAAAVSLAAWRSGMDDASVPETRAGLPEDVAGVWRFYWPLASSMLVVWGGRAMLLAVIARAVDGPIALAAWPAAWSLVLLVSNATRMVQQVVIRNRETVAVARLWIFAGSVGVVFAAALVAASTTSAGLAIVARFIGSDADLLGRVMPVIAACVLVPVLVALQNAAQGFLIAEGRTRQVSIATWVGTVVLLTTAVTAVRFGLPGALSAGVSMVIALAIELVCLLRGLCRTGLDRAIVVRV